MAEDVIKVSCPGCGVEFELPPEMGGEMGECTECGSVFEIPKIESIQSGETPTTDTGSVKVSKAAAGATNTLKLSRASIGMVPDIKDNFKFETVKTSTRIGMDAFEREAAPLKTTINQGPVRQSHPQWSASTRPWWKRILFFWQKG